MKKDISPESQWRKAWNVNIVYYNSFVLIFGWYQPFIIHNYWELWTSGFFCSYRISIIFIVTHEHSTLSFVTTLPLNVSTNIRPCSYICCIATYSYLFSNTHTHTNSNWHILLCLNYNISVSIHTMSLEVTFITLILPNGKREFWIPGGRI